MKNTIKCPKCKHEFEASVGFMAHLKEEAKAETEKKLRREIEEQNSLELEDLQKSLKEKEEKITQFRDKEIELREKSRKLEDKEKDLELETQRRIDEEKKNIEEHTTRRLLDEHHLKDLEKDKSIMDMKRLIEELKQKSTQGSMQAQGEVAELDLEETLRRLFPTDEISEVKKGELGGDIRQLVRTQRGTECGMILWERKRTKAWSDDWVKKLKGDMARDKAHLGVIVTAVLPKDQKKEIGERGGVWVVTTAFVEPLAGLLRRNLYDIAKGKAITLNKQSKAESLYDFVTGREFITSVENMVETYIEIKSQITRERIVSEKLWKQREMQVDKLLSGVSGMYGGLQEIAGTALPQVKNLELDSGEE